MSHQEIEQIPVVPTGKPSCTPFGERVGVACPDAVAAGQREGDGQTYWSSEAMPVVVCADDSAISLNGTFGHPQRELEHEETRRR